MKKKTKLIVTIAAVGALIASLAKDKKNQKDK